MEPVQFLETVYYTGTREEDEAHGEDVQFK